ncbi:hypothetical protein TIFTF001_016820 [Ficus carica]|uniref:SWIM-type domain-containing protein n=1 Tax=Ficus carica TaxID=3494 RepID=A0AA88ATR5_FICCA|nr:hypothetical protein TIFTF001_016820 [Ficus carica]
MDEVCVFVKYNGQWDGTLRCVGGEMKGILMPVTATYVGVIELCDADVKFYIQLKKKDVNVLSKFPIIIDVLDKSAAEAMPPEVGESNHIDVQPFREGGQSDEAMQLVNDSNLIIRPPHIPSPTLVMDLHTEDGIEKQHQLLNNDLCMDHDDCNAGELNVADAARHSNEKSITATASKHGWPYCRPVIVVDGSALKARFGGMLLAAYGHDANGSIFPLAFGIVSSKTNNVYPDVAFGICIQHLAANLKTRYKDFKGPLKTYFDGASRSYLVSEHQRHMESIRNRNPYMHRYLVQSDLTKWSRAYFNGRKYTIMITNIVESLSNVDRKARREEALKITSKLAPKAEKLIYTNFSLGLAVTLRPADQFEYAVTNNAIQTWIVDMSERTCTCRRFQVDQIPCPHAMAVSQKAEMFLKKSDRKLSILPIQCVVLEGHGFVGFCPKVNNMRLFGVVDVMVMDTTTNLY